MLLCDLISELADGRFDSIGRGQRLLVLQAFNRRTMRSWVERQKEPQWMTDVMSLGSESFSDGPSDGRQAQACGYQGLRRRKHRSPAPD